MDAKRLNQGAAVLRLLSSLAFILFLAVDFSTAQAQTAVLGRGDAVVTGFSGIKPADAPLPPGANPLDEFFIDLEGASAQIQSLATLGQPAQGQLVTAPSKLPIKARQVGQVFAIALDDGLGAATPNIYLGATAVFGLQIVVPDSDGDGAPERVRKGQPDAQWMAGQFGLDAGGGPGSIWKVDGLTGAVTLFATLPGNSAPGVGDVVFDSVSRQFFASDLDSGLIYRIGANGAVIDSFDHGVTGRPQKGLPPIADDGQQADIKSTAFDSEAPESWGFTQEPRRVHGLALRDGRLYYAVAGQVWSIAISPSGFGGDARWEFDAKGLTGEGPITDMLFDAQGRIYLAQRGKQHGSYDYSVFAEPEKSEVVRYRREEPDNPATESVWFEEQEAYAIGMPPEHRHAEGGIALGYAHDEAGTLRYGACGAMLWSTGHRLRSSEDDEAAGEADVHGLQGNDVDLVRPQNAPPRQSYFTDYDNLFGDAAKAGHVGDVEIWQPCDNIGFVPPSGQFPPGIYPPGDTPPELPPEFPPNDYHTNLKLTKRAMPKTCAIWGGGWLCRYRVRVTNTGPDNYFGLVSVHDWLPAHPAGAIMAFAPQPPWLCGPLGPSDFRCVRNVFLPPTASVDLYAYAWVPKTYPLCHLTNGAAIEWAPPGSQWNSDPFDDLDFASATIPADHCKPGQRSDLTIHKQAVGKCFPFAGKMRCAYLIGVQNLGPATYNGPLEVKDTVPAGTTATFAPMPWAPCAGPVGNSYSCDHPGVNLTSGAFAPLLGVAVDVPIAVAKQLGCKVRNDVAITSPLGAPHNFDATNDAASAVAIVPPEICDQQPRESNLKLVKTASHTHCVSLGGADWCAMFDITITNTGPFAFKDVIKVTDILPAGVSGTINGGAAWTCMGLTCQTNADVTLNKNPPSADSTVLHVTVSGSAEAARAMNCKLTNKAKIDSPLGVPKNVLAGDDMDQVTVDLPARFCNTPPSSQPQCPPGYRWNGERCDRPDPTCKPGWTRTPVKGICCPPREPWNAQLRQCGGDDTPPPPPPPPSDCKRGWTPTPVPGICCPPGERWLGRRCGQDVPPPQCPDGYRGSYPNCWKPEGPSCNRIARCTNGTVWNMKACSCICPQGRVMKGGQCVTDQPECPPNMVGRPPHCRQIQTTCPRGMVGTPPNCHRRVCPPGTRGIYPYCKRTEVEPPRRCPPGMVGRVPNCTRIIRVCPPGTFGRPPFCRSRILGTPGGRGPNPRRPWLDRLQNRPPRQSGGQLPPVR